MESPPRSIMPPDSLHRKEEMHPEQRVLGVYKYKKKYEPIICAIQL